MKQHKSTQFTDPQSDAQHPTKIKHIKDTAAKHTKPSYQTIRQGLRQSDTKDNEGFKREALGFTGRDTRGYDKQHKGKY